MAFNTPTNPEAFSPNITFFKAEDVLPNLLVHEITTVAGTIEGDRPSVLVPYVDLDGGPDFVNEGATIDPSDPVTSQVAIQASKIALLVKASREQLRQDGATGLLTASAGRAMVKKANSALLSQGAPVGGGVNHPVEGLLAQIGAASATVADNLDEIVEAVRTVEDAYGTASHVLTSPAGWSELSRLKTADSSNQPLLGSGVEAGVRQVLGLPVIVSPEVPETDLVVLDRTAIISAVSQLEFATSEDFYFGDDSTAVRFLLRQGAVVADSDRVVRLTIGEGDGS